MLYEKLRWWDALGACLLGIAVAIGVILLLDSVFWVSKWEKKVGGLSGPWYITYPTIPFRQGKKPFRQGKNPFRQGKKPFHQEEKALHQGKTPLHQEEKPFRQGKKPLHQGQNYLHQRKKASLQGQKHPSPQQRNNALKKGYGDDVLYGVSNRVWGIP